MVGYVYMMTNAYNKVLYTGVTNDLHRRVYEHKAKPEGFVARYNVQKLVWFAEYFDMREAIAEETRLKAGPRQQKEAFIEAKNPQWADLMGDLI